MKAPSGINASLKFEVTTGSLLTGAVNKGRAFEAKPWYIEPTPFEGSPFPRDGGNIKVVRTAATKALAKFMDTVAEPEPPGYYVIVGTGAAAVVNHTTLRQTKAGWERIGKSPVVHVGFEDPWRHYRNHQMGQIANLLCMPGYARTPVTNGEDLRAPRQSSTFAADTLSELRRLATHFPFGEVKAWVASIQDRSKGKPQGKVLEALEADLGAEWTKCEALLDSDYPANYPPLRLLLIDKAGTPRLLYATQVDICAGNGRPRISIPKRDEATAKYGAKPWDPPENWLDVTRRRTILSGLEALCQETEWPANQYICIMGSGGVGVNMIEIARESSNVRADWMANGTTHLDSFFNPRNDPLLKAWFVPADPKDPFAQQVEIQEVATKAKGALAIAGLEGSMRTNLGSVLIPASDSWRFMQRVWIENGGTLNQGQPPTGMKFGRFPNDSLRDAAAAAKELPTMGIDSAGNMVKLIGDVFPFANGDPAPAYDRVILCSGQDFAASGQPRAITDPLLRKEVIKGPGDRLVGLALADGKVRVLGAAATANNEWVKSFANGEVAMQTLRDFAATIPAQAGSAVNLALFGLNCLNVACANKFFPDGVKNSNVNLATQEEIAALIGNAGMAREIVDKRKQTANGFQNLDDLIGQVWGTAPPSNATTTLAPLTYAYPWPPNT